MPYKTIIFTCFLLISLAGFAQSSKINQCNLTLRIFEKKDMQKTKDAAFVIGKQHLQAYSLDADTIHYENKPDSLVESLKFYLDKATISQLTKISSLSVIQLVYNNDVLIDATNKSIATAGTMAPIAFVRDTFIEFIVRSPMDKNIDNSEGLRRYLINSCLLNK